MNLFVSNNPTSLNKLVKPFAAVMDTFADGPFEVKGGTIVKVGDLRTINHNPTFNSYVNDARLSGLTHGIQINQTLLDGM